MCLPLCPASLSPCAINGSPLAWYAPIVMRQYLERIEATNGADVLATAAHTRSNSGVVSPIKVSEPLLAPLLPLGLSLESVNVCILMRLPLTCGTAAGRCCPLRRRLR